MTDFKRGLNSFRLCVKEMFMSVETIAVPAAKTIMKKRIGKCRGRNLR